jgi:hypothetical protein
MGDMKSAVCYCIVPHKKMNCTYKRVCLTLRGRVNIPFLWKHLGPPLVICYRKAVWSNREGVYREYSFKTNPFYDKLQ